MTDINLHQDEQNDEQRNEGGAHAFQFGDYRIRVAKVDNHGTWFIARDVCDALDITWSGSTLQALEPEDRGCHTMTTPSGEQEMAIVNEAGLYQLVFRSRKPEAKVFRRWVTSEVLPAIRQMGYYAKPGTVLAPGTESQLLAVLVRVNECLTRIDDRLTRVDDRLARIDERVTRLEQGRTMFTCLGIGGAVPPRTLRAELEALTDEVARRMHCLPGTVMIALYKEVRLRHHIDYRARKQRAHRKTGRRYAVLDFVERDGNLPALYNLALEHFAHLLDCDLQPESTRDAVFMAEADPPDDEQEEASLEEITRGMPLQTLPLGGAQ